MGLDTRDLLGFGIRDGQMSCRDCYSGSGIVDYK